MSSSVGAKEKENALPARGGLLLCAFVDETSISEIIIVVDYAQALRWLPFIMTIRSNPNMVTAS